MSIAFRDLEADVKGHMEAAERDMTVLRATLPASPDGAFVNRADANRRIQATLQNAKSGISSMAMEATDGTEEERAVAKARLAEFKTRLQKLAVDADELKKRSEAADRTDLLARTAAAKDKGVAVNSADSAVATAMETNDIVKRSTEKTKEMERHVFRMNEVGQATLAELGRQDATIDRIAEVTNDADKDLSTVQHTLIKMEKVMQKNKLMLVGAIFILTMMIVGIGYYMVGRWTSGSSTSTTTTSTTSTTTTGGGTGSFAASPAASPSVALGTYGGGETLPASLISMLP